VFVMISYEQSLIEFSKMDYKAKKKKVIAMLDILKDGKNIFQDLYDLIKITQTPSETILEMIHKVVTKAMYSMQDNQMQDAINELKSVKDKMDKIRKREAKESQDPDKILDNL